jgi:hypothetical protein
MWTLRRQASVIYHAFDVDLAKAQASGNRNKYDELAQQQQFEASEYQDKLRCVRTRRLLMEAETLYIHIPDLRWESGQFSQDRFLDDASESKLYYAVKEQKEKRREYYLKLATAITGMIGALIGLIAIVKK